MRRVTAKLMLFGSAVLLASQSVLAQVPPGGGGQIQQISPPPVLQKSIPEIRIERGNLPALPNVDESRIEVRSLRVTGQTAYSESQLAAVAGFGTGGRLTLSELRDMAQKIADFYHRNGYVVAQAYLPAQDIKDGSVTIAVIEGQYGRIVLRNASSLATSIAEGLLDGLKTGDAITIAPLEERLLLLSDIPGVNVKSTLVPGSTVGTSDLIVDVTPGRSVSGSVEADNGGSRYTGEYRVGASVNLNNISGHGDVLGLRVLTSGQGLTYGRAFYQTLVGKATVGVAYTSLTYHLGREFAPLQAHGTAQIATLYASYPLIRSRNTNLYAIAAFDAKTFHDQVDATVPPGVTDRKIGVVSGGLYGNHRDGIGGGGLNTFGLTGFAGNLDIITPAALTADAATARSNGSYQKLAFQAGRVQYISPRVSLYGGINGQLASKNLDISEKMSLGGPYGVRAYPVGEAYADEGYIATLEARLLLPKFSESMRGQMHLIGFADTGSVTINKNPWAPGDNHRTLSGAGIGLTWAEYNNFSASVYYAWKLGSARATSAPDASGRLWFQLVKFF